MVRAVHTFAYNVMPMSDDNWGIEDTPGEVLRKYREQRGWSLRDVAKRAGVVHGTVRNVEQRLGGWDQLKDETISKLAVGYRMDETKFRRILSGEALAGPTGRTPDDLRVHPDWLVFPVRETASAGDSEPAYLVGEVAYIPREHLRRKGALPENVTVFMVNGHCMISDEARRVEKNYAHGDYVAVDTTRPPKNGETVVGWWREEEKLVLKRFGVDSDDVTLYPLSSNYPPIELKADDDLILLGPVVWRGG